LLMIDPVVAPNLTAFLARYGITLAEDLVYDPENRLFGGDALSPIISLYNTGVPIVKDFHVNTIFSLARSVEPTEPSPGDHGGAVLPHQPGFMGPVQPDCYRAGRCARVRGNQGPSGSDLSSSGGNDQPGPPSQRRDGNTRAG